jgi:DNA-binding transcriptional regulator/RsmH inhibitor MraZ
MLIRYDKRGRLVLPAKIRKSLDSNLLFVRKTKNRIELIPLPDPKSLRGKYKIEGELTEIEELQEKKLERV